MKKALAISTFCLLVLLSTRYHAAVMPTIKQDLRCVAYQAAREEPEACNVSCSSECVDFDLSCPYGNPDPGRAGCIVLEDPFDDPGFEDINIFGVSFGPADEAIPYLVRLFFMALFSFIGLASMGYAFYGLYLRTTAMESAEKVEKMAEVYKSVILGVVVTFGGVFIFQAAAVLIGLEGNVFYFNLIPKQGELLDASNRFCASVGTPPSVRCYYEEVSLDEEDVETGRCLSRQMGRIGAATYVCLDRRWLRV